MAGFLDELKRRHVMRAAVAYLVVAWLVVQVADVMIDLAGLPDWIGQVVLWLLAIAFPIVLVVSWFYEITPQGITADSDIPRTESAVHLSRRRFELIVMSLLAAAVLLFAYDKWWTGARVEQSIAVLPFVDLSPDGDQGYFSDGIAEELLNELTKLRGLRVAGRTSSFSFRNSNQDVREIGKQLSVANVLEGSVRKSGDRFRISVQLVAASDGFELWSQSFDRDLTDIFTVQEQIAKAVATALSVSLGVGEIGFAAGGTRNFEAYDARLEAQSILLNLGPENIPDAIILLERAVELDPGYGDAWSTLGEAYSRARFFSDPSQARTYIEKSENAVRRAIDVAPQAIGSLRAQGGQLRRHGRFREAEQAFERALELAPGDLSVNISYGNFLLSVGRATEAIGAFATAAKADPLAMAPLLALSEARVAVEDFDRALGDLYRAKDLIGNELILDASIALVAMEADERELLEQYLELLAKRETPSRDGRTFSQEMLALLDSPEIARQELRQIYAEPMSPLRPPDTVILFWAAHFGDDELVLEMTRSNVELQGTLTAIVWRPLFKGIRRLPGFKELVSQSGLVEYWRSSGNWGQFCRPIGDTDFECM